MLFVDAARFAAPDGHRPGADWAALAAAVHTAVDVLDAPQAPLPVGAARLSPLDLLDEDVDLAPAHRVGPGAGAGPDGTELPASWEELALLLHEGAELSRTLAEFACEKVRSPGTFTLGELVKAGVLTLRAGRQPSDRTGPATDDGLVPLLTVRDVVRGGAPVERVPPASGLAVAEEGDVVVVGTARAFRAWVHSGPPLALGPQLYALRAAPGRLDAHFLAGCLRAPANGRRAGTHVSGAARIDVRRLRVPGLPLDEQELYAEVFRRLSALDGMLTRAGRLGGGLRDELTDLLAAGGRVGSAG
ncbi:hypothetical protein ACFWIN_06285 [Streptomyces sp. NPDC127049]|uniref:hypothetical protein n=1 Tax=Streptomyces sp. NPDC127049 TaxID=3347118 RepID=UPI00365941C2